MLRYLVSRLLQGLLVIFCLYTITFFLVRAVPGDPFTDEKAMSEQNIERQKAYWGLDQPLPIQYLRSLKKTFLEFDFGPSMKKEGRLVIDIIGQSFPVSFVLGFGSLGFALLLGIPSGILSALKRNSPADYASMGVALIGICVPSFVIGPVLVILVAAQVAWLNVAGWDSPTDWILPSFTLGFSTAAYIARLTRGGMLDVLNQDYIRTAYAKGVPPLRVILLHALRGGVTPAVAFIGPAFAALISGSFIVETIFFVPGMGQHFLNAATGRDYTLMQGLVMFYGFLIVLANLSADILQAALNPRVRLTD
ncbi:MAG: ABC transporter permease [Verrucomicrobiota bacterium]